VHLDHQLVRRGLRLGCVDDLDASRALEPDDVHGAHQVLLAVGSVIARLANTGAQPAPLTRSIHSTSRQ
jgi:hypothetical protein